MSPVQIEILLHYYYSPEDYPRTLIAPQLLEELRSIEMLKLVRPDKRGDAHYELSPRGCAYVEFLLAVPLPEMKWVMPGE